MKQIAIGVLLFGSLAARAQTTSFDQVPHIETSLNHLTIIDVGEPVTDLAIADRDAFQIERRENRVFLMPLRDGVATNMFIWTATRQLNYEIDAAGELGKMNVMVRALPQPVTHLAASSPSDQDIQKITSLVLTEALLGTEQISQDEKRETNNSVRVELTQVFRAKSQLFIRYIITNLSKDPFRVTPPDIYQPSPTQIPISLISLRNHQLSQQAYEAFKPKQGATVPLTSNRVDVNDLASGQRTSGVLSIRKSDGTSPQLYQLRFGASQTGAITVEAVL